MAELRTAEPTGKKLLLIGETFPTIGPRAMLPSSPSTSRANAVSGPIILKAIWFALTASQLFYWVVLAIQPPGQTPGTSLPIWILAATSGLVSLILFRMRLGSESIQKALATFGAKLGLSKLFPIYIVCWALNESIVIFGFVSTLAFHRPAEEFLPYLAAGLILNAIMFPRVGDAFKTECDREMAS